MFAGAVTISASRPSVSTARRTAAWRTPRSADVAAAMAESIAPCGYGPAGGGATVTANCVVPELPAMSRTVTLTTTPMGVVPRTLKVVWRNGFVPEAAGFATASAGKISHVYVHPVHGPSSSRVAEASNTTTCPWIGDSGTITIDGLGAVAFFTGPVSAIVATRVSADPASTPNGVANTLTLGAGVESGGAVTVNDAWPPLPVTTSGVEAVPVETPTLTRWPATGSPNSFRTETVTVDCDCPLWSNR